jgi:lipoprotein-anchoring transpeptidase ErfK/SrfK
VSGRRLAALAVIIAAAAAPAVVVLRLVLEEDEPSPTRVADPTAGVPDPVTPAFARAKPVPISSQRVWRWAPVVRAVFVQARPSASAPPIGRLATRTPEKTRNIVLVRSRAEDRAGRLWLHVSVPGLPGKTAGWVPRSAVGGYGAVRTRLVVELKEFTATLFRDGRRVFKAPIGIGKRPWPTPKGSFYIRNKLTRFKSAFYGPLAFGISARSPGLTDWPAGGFVGIHGTNAPQLLPGAVSHGCIRMRNEDILRLGTLMPVGTPITIK